jgi:hypothetical protein
MMLIATHAFMVTILTTQSVPRISNVLDAYQKYKDAYIVMPQTIVSVVIMVTLETQQQTYASHVQQSMDVKNVLILQHVNHVFQDIISTHQINVNNVKQVVVLVIQVGIVTYVQLDFI